MTTKSSWRFQTMKVEISSSEDVTTTPRPSRSDQDLKQLARDVHAGLVFGTWNVESETEIGMVFMPILLASSVTRKMMERDGIIHLYEYLDKSAPRSINGMPIFFSLNTLNKEETEKLIEYVKILKQMEDTFMRGNDAN